MDLNSNKPHVTKSNLRPLVIDTVTASQVNAIAELSDVFPPQDDPSVFAWFMWTLRDLMLAGFALLFLLAPAADAQAVWRGRTYNGRVCSNPFCSMCNSIQRQLNRQRSQRPVAPSRVVSAFTTPASVPQPVVVPKPTPANGNHVSVAEKLTHGDPHGASHPEIIDHALRLLKMKPGQILFDVGCGDARVLIQAANEYGCEGIGIEIDPKKAGEARATIRAAGLSDQIKIITGDARDLNPLRYEIDAVYSYLYPELLEELAPLFRHFPRGVFPLHKPPGLKTTTYRTADPHNVVYLYEQQNEQRVVFRPLGSGMVAAARTTQTQPKIEATTRHVYTAADCFIAKVGAEYCQPCRQMNDAIGDGRVLVASYSGGNVRNGYQSIDFSSLSAEKQREYQVSQLPTTWLQYYDHNAGKWKIEKRWVGLVSVGTLNAATQTLLSRLNK